MSELKEEIHNVNHVTSKQRVIEQSALHTYLANKKKITPAKQITLSVSPAVQTSVKHSIIIQNKPVKKQPTIPDNTTIHAMNAHVLPAMQQALVLKSYSPSTIRTYINEAGVIPSNQTTSPGR
jgi:hypothetical protein